MDAFTFFALNIVTLFFLHLGIKTDYQLGTIFYGFSGTFSFALAFSLVNDFTGQFSTNLNYYLIGMYAIFGLCCFVLAIMNMVNRIDHDNTMEDY